MHDGNMEVHLRSLGGTLRALRTERGYSLGDVSSGTGLSTSFLSLVENGRSDISTGRLHRLARFLDVGLGDLLGMNALREPTIARAGERRAIDLAAKGLRMYPLVSADDVAMVPIISELAPGAQLGDLERTEGVEYFVLVLDGTIEIGLATTGLVVLALGDTIYFGSPGPTSVCNPGEAPAVMLWVTSPQPAGRRPRNRFQPQEFRW